MGGEDSTVFIEGILFLWGISCGWLTGRLVACQESVNSRNVPLFHFKCLGNILLTGGGGGSSCDAADVGGWCSVTATITHRNMARPCDSGCGVGGGFRKGFMDEREGR